MSRKQPAENPVAGRSGPQQVRASERPRQPGIQHRTFISSSSHVEDVLGKKPLNSYFITLMHIIKCYIGTGIFAMGEGFKNSGLLLGPILMFFLAAMNLHCQHILIKTAIKIASGEDELVKPSFAETVQYSMEYSTIACLRNNSNRLGWMTTVFLCCVELGFCSVYLVFIAHHLLEVADSHDLMDAKNPLNSHVMLAIILGPTWLTTFLGNLKLLLPLSIFANLLMWAGVMIIFYFTIFDEYPAATDTNLISSYRVMPLFFGTALYAFEGITFVIPLRNEMKKPEKFISAAGVLNVGMTLVAALFILVGTLAYWKYGEGVASSVFLNIQKDHQIVGDAVNIMMALAVLFTYTLHMYIPFEVTFPLFYRKYGPFKHGLIVTYIYRSVPVLLTYIVANIVPFLGLFISLIGASVGAFLALILPPILDLTAFREELSWLMIAKDILIISIGCLGFITGTIMSIYDIVTKFIEEYG